MNHILTKYGYCIIKPGTILRTFKTADFTLHDSVFFYITPIEEESHHGDILYEFVVHTQIVCLCPIVLNRAGKTFTYFKDIFENDMNIQWKYRNNVNMKSNIIERKKLISFLTSNDIPGWLCAEEHSLYQSEVFLIHPERYVTSAVPKVISNINYVQIKLGAIVDINEFHDIFEKRLALDNILQITFL